MEKPIKQGHLGVIEGFYGQPWGFEKRKAMIPFMQNCDYSFYLYAPKADRFFREDWKAELPKPLFEQLGRLGGHMRDADIDWGIGLSPFELHLDFNQAGKDALLKRIEEIQKVGCNWLAILFDDMKGDLPDLAMVQIEICDFVRQHSSFDRFLMCPSYYCFDPVLEKVFGKMPDNYLNDLGRNLAEEIEIFWTGEKVCSSAYPKAHLEEVENLLKRKPFLWDNYPVNDGARMSPFLHLSPFTGREYCTEEYISGIAVNPMNEACLSRLPMATLHDCLLDPGKYQPEESLGKHAMELLGAAGAELLADLELFEKLGLDNLDKQQVSDLILKYRGLADADNSSMIDELVAYLNGDYRFDLNSDEVPTQSLWAD